MIQDKHKTKAQLIEELENPRQHLSALELEVARRKRAEGALKKSERSLAKVEETGRIGSWEWDIETDKGSWSHQTYRMFGFEPGEINVAFDTFLTRMHPYDRARVAREIEVAVNEHKAFDMEYRVFRKDGNEVLVHSRGEVTVDKTGKPIGMVGVIQDITERKRAEEALRESEELRNLAERLNTIREEERTVIARELHDEIGQVLAALRRDLHSMSNGLPEDLVGEREQALAMLDQIDAAADSVRELSSRLRPPLPDDLRLGALAVWARSLNSSRLGSAPTGTL